MGKYGFDRLVIEEIRDAVDVGEYLQSLDSSVEFRQSGPRRITTCVFHKERTGSFTIAPDGKFYHCFGCGAGGDVFKLAQDFKNFTFPEALEHLARYAHVDLPSKGIQRVSDYDPLRQAVEFAQNHFMNNLKNSADALEYVKEKRGLSERTIEQWGIGFSRPDWDGLSRQLGVFGKSFSAAADAGLITPRDSGNGYYDFFRNRVMLPVYTHLDRLVGFGGRALDPNDNIKYMNSRDSPLYKKNELLFGLNHALTPIKAEDEAVIVEGYFDAITLHQLGLTNVVGLSSASFTISQAKLLRRFCSKAFFLFDNDPTGRVNALKAAQLAYRAGLEPTIGLLGNSVSSKKVDPDEFFRASQDPHELFDELQKNHLVDYYLKVMPEPKGLDDKLKIMDDALGFFSFGSVPLSRQMLWVDELSCRLGVDDHVIRRRYFEALERKHDPSPQPSIYEDSSNIAAAFVAHLLTQTPADVQRISREVPSDSKIFDPELRDLYNFAVSRSDIHGGLRSQRDQFHLFHEQELEKVVSVLHEGVVQGAIPRIHPSVSRVLSQGLTANFDVCHAIVKRLRRREEVEDALASLRRARLDNDEEAIYELQEHLEVLLN